MILLKLQRNKRCNSIVRTIIPIISPKVLAKDLKEHKLIKRTIYEDPTILIEYKATEYVFSFPKKK